MKKSNISSSNRTSRQSQHWLTFIHSLLLVQLPAFVYACITNQSRVMYYISITTFAISSCMNILHSDDSVLASGVLSSISQRLNAAFPQISIETFLEPFHQHNININSLVSILLNIVLMLSTLSVSNTSFSLAYRTLFVAKTSPNAHRADGKWISKLWNSPFVWSIFRMLFYIYLSVLFETEEVRELAFQWGLTELRLAAKSSQQNCNHGHCFHVRLVMFSFYSIQKMASYFPRSIKPLIVVKRDSCVGSPSIVPI